MTAATSLSLAARRAQVRVATRATVVTSRRLGVATFAKNATDGSERRRQRVCVLGGGFGGLYTALRLKSLRWPASAAEVDRVAKRGEDMLAASAALRPPQLPMSVMSNAPSSSRAGEEGPEVILVDKSDRFIFKPMLYELLLDDAQVWEICPRYDDLLAGTGVRFVRDEVKAVEPGKAVGDAGAEGTVTLSSGESIEYDWLVVALGAGPRATSVSGARENATPFATLEHALQISTRLAEIQARRLEGKVLVVGGGVSGVEVASTISQRLGPDRVTVLHGGDKVMEGAPAKQREAARKVLERRGVTVRTNFRVSSVAPGNGDEGMKVVTGCGQGGDEESLEADLVVWTAGQSPVSGPLVDSFPQTDTGAVQIEPTLQVQGHPRVYAVGDVVLGDKTGGAEGVAKPLPATAQVAFQQSDFAAWNIWSSINGKAQLPFRYQHLGDMMLLGSTDAAMTPLGIEGLTLDGPVAAAIRKATYLYRMPTAGHAAKVGASWALKPLLQYVSSRF